jgi:hypothetical protein
MVKHSQGTENPVRDNLTGGATAKVLRRDWFCEGALVFLGLNPHRYGC